MPVNRTYSPAKPLTLFVVLALCIGFSHPLAAADAILKRIVMSTGGVAYYEYEAQVTDNDTLALSVPLDQVDDILKSLVISDDGGGDAVLRLPGRRPLKEIFRDLPFGPGDLRDPVRLLNALKGAEVIVTGPRNLKGRIIRVSREKPIQGKQGDGFARHRVGLLTAQGLQQFILEEADSVQIADPDLRHQVETGLRALAQHRARDRRTLVIDARGKGDRRLRFGYVAGAPLWKISYRLIIPASDKGTTARLQGWAVVENLSGQNWRNVDLSLVSGNPVTFRQALYTPYFLHRPNVPIEVGARMLPPPDEGALRERAQSLGERRGQARKRARIRARATAKASRRNAPSMAKPSTKSALSMVSRDMMERPPAPPLPPRPVAAQAASAETVTQVVFHFPRPQSLRNGFSVMVPIINRDVPSERVAWYRPSLNRNHPLAAVRLTNKGGTGLPAGILTLLEEDEAGRRNYIGDARIKAFPKGETRLLSFAVDQKVTVQKDDTRSRKISEIRAANGYLQIRTVINWRTQYRLKGPLHENRKLIIEHPRNSSWELVQPNREGVKITTGHYRLPVQLEKGKQRDFEVVVRQTLNQRHRIADFKGSQLAFYARSGELDAKARKLFEKLVALRREIATMQRQDRDIEQNRQRIFREQSRIRKNMKSISRQSKLFNRYQRKLDQQETRMEALLTQADDLRDALRAAREGFAAYAGKMTF